MKRSQNIILLFFLLIPLFVKAGTQIQFNKSVVYIKDTVNLSNKLIRLPEHSTIVFDGGIIMNGFIEGCASSIEAGCYPIFSNVTLKGTWDVPTSYPEWFNGVGDGKTDCSSAIEKALAITKGDLVFQRGTYCISAPIYSMRANIKICNGDTLRAIKPMNYMILQESADKGVYTLRTNTVIEGGGVIDGNRLAKIGITLRKCHGATIRDLTVMNTTQYGFQAALNSQEAGNSIVTNVKFLNPYHIESAIAINNNRNDCMYENVGIVNFKTGVVTYAGNAKFTNVQPWISYAPFWKESVAFDCYSPWVMMVGCGADTMRRLIKCHNNYFFASIVNCAAFKNDGVVSDELAKQYPPIIIDKNGAKYSQIQMIGGVYWYNVPYTLFSDVSSSDQILINRYNTSKTSQRSNVTNGSDK